MNKLFPLIDYKHELFQEYEDECSLVLWCYGCNWKCNWCSLKNIIYNKNLIIDEDYIYLINNTTDMETAVVFLGGEPTLYEEGLISGCKIAKINNLKTKIFTNGSNPDIILKLIDMNLLDAISIDCKDVNDELILLKKLPKDFNIDIRVTLHKGITKNNLIKIQEKVKKINTNAKFYYQDLI